MRYYLAAFLALSFFVAPWLSAAFPGPTESVLNSISKAGEQIAAVILARNPVTVEQLKIDYAAAESRKGKKIRILVVPGHEPGFGGTEYGPLKERDLNVEVAENLIGYLRRNPRYEVFTTRDKSAWLPEFSSYFKADRDEIVAWQKNNKTEQKRLIEVGSFTPSTPVIYHNTVDTETGIRLHGINKWANENNIDIAIHIHFNDWPHTRGDDADKYTGFAIYVPEPQFANSASAKALAGTVFKRLAKYNPISNLRGESSGIVEEQDLIAIGSYNSLDAASMLIEYSYIYEPQLADRELRGLFLKEVAYETYLGLLDFFDEYKAAEESLAFDTLVLPHRWEKPLSGKGDSPAEVFALQTALMLDGDYPPRGSSQRDCPRTGKLGPCTRSALEWFKKKYDISGEKEIAGQKTLDVLNRIFSSQAL